MTKRLHIYCAIVMGAMAFSATAQEGREKPKRPAVGFLLRALDTNGDGALDASEIAAASASLEKLDRDGDGKISGKELAPKNEVGKKPGAQPQRARFDLAAMDKDGDGKLSKQEVPERMRERFDRMDRDGDGFIDKEEQELVKRYIRQRMQDGAGGGKGRRPADEGQGGSEKPKRPARDDS